MHRIEFSKPQSVTIAVALLGGDTVYVDHEDVPLKVNDIAPGRFNWRKYSERIDLDAVNGALRHAKKPQNGGLVHGLTNILEPQRGDMLQPKGRTLEQCGNDPLTNSHQRLIGTLNLTQLSLLQETNMGFFRRISTTFKTNENAASDKAEDSDRRSNQINADKQKQLVTTKQHIATPLSQRDPIEKLNLIGYSFNALTYADVQTVGELLKLVESGEHPSHSRS